jgi:hypothetical protein
MFTVEMTESFGPFAGQGGYATVKGVGSSKSPLQAWKKARKDLGEKIGEGPIGGGVPILFVTRIWRGTKLIKEKIW